MNIIEILGYVASVIILISLLMKSLVKLRWINLIGAALFSLYGLFIQAWPVFGINAVIAVIDAWFLWQMKMQFDYFDISPASEIGREYFQKIFLYYEKDILSFFPDASFESLLEVETFMLFRNMLPVGLFAIRMEGEEANIVADYVTPEYRDFKVGVFVYRIKRMYFKEHGIKRFVAKSAHEAHSRYLRRNGFDEAADNPGTFVKVL